MITTNSLYGSNEALTDRCVTVSDQCWIPHLLTTRSPSCTPRSTNFQINTAISLFSADFGESVALISNEDVVELDETVDDLQTQLKDVGLMG